MISEGSARLRMGSVYDVQHIAHPPIQHTRFEAFGDARSVRQPNDTIWISYSNG